MSNTVTGTMPQAVDQHDPIRGLLRAGHNDEAIVRLCAITITRPDDLLARELLFDAFFQKRDWAPAFVLAEQLTRARPDSAGLQKSLIATLSNMKRFDEAIAKALQHIERHGEDLTILDTLKVANFYTGKVGERSVMANARSSYGTRKPAGCPASSR
jgi:predicted Zn-dependent protease